MSDDPNSRHQEITPRELLVGAAGNALWAFISWGCAVIASLVTLVWGHLKKAPFAETMCWASGLFVLVAIAGNASVWIWQKRKKSLVENLSVVPRITAEAKQAQRGQPGNEFYCEVSVEKVERAVAAYLTKWIPAPSQQIQHKMSHAEQIPRSTDLPIALKHQAGNAFLCFRMPREGSEPTIEILSEGRKFLSFQTQEPIFDIEIEAREGPTVLMRQAFQIEIVRGAGATIGHFKIRST